MPAQGTASSLGKAFSRALRLMPFLFNVSVAVVALWLFLRPGAVHVPFFRPQRVIYHPEVEFKDFVAILLTALGVMIALGSGLVAVLAIFGYAEGRKMIEGLVRDEVRVSLPPLIARAVMDQRAPETTPADADRIAQAFDDVR